MPARLGHLTSTATQPGEQKNEELLDVDSGSGFDKLFLDGFGFFLVDAFLDGLRSAVHQILGFLQAQAGDFADHLEDADLVGTRAGENNRELGLFFGSRSRRTTASNRSSRNRSSGSRYTQLFFQQLDQLRRLEQRQALNLFRNRI